MFVFVNVLTSLRVKVELVPPENFRISRDATYIDDAAFVGIQTEMTRSEIRKYYPDMAESIDAWDELGDDTWSGSLKYSQDIAARKQVTGQEYTQGSLQQETSIH